MLTLLERLKDDPELYVRRSVANNLNDIGKDHPDLLVETARRWMIDATQERRRLIRHALRSAIKRGEPGALGVLGFGKKVNVAIRNATITPKRPRTGGSVTIGFEVVNKGSRRQRVLVDFRVHFVKANGKPARRRLNSKQSSSPRKKPSRFENDLIDGEDDAEALSRNAPGGGGVERNGRSARLV